MSVRTILEITKEMRDIFSEYELTRREMVRTQELIDKLEHDQITVSVIGQFKRGKSYTVNSILGDKILPIGIVPVTAVVTTVEYGEKAATVRFENGIVKEIPFDGMSAFINEQENNDNHLGVQQVEIYWPSDFLKDGMTLVDTPGVGSVHQKNTDAAYSYVKESDGVIFLLSVDSPINQIEIDFLRNAKEYAAKFYFAVNKIDTIPEDDLNEYLDYCRKLIGKIMETDQVQLYPVSAKTGEGIGELKNAIEKDCQTTVRDIIAKSAKLKMRDIGAAALSQISLYRRTLQMTHKEFDRTFEALNEFLEEIKKEGREFGPQFKSNPRMLEAQLNDMKNRLSGEVRELFGIDYHYDISTVDFFRGGKVQEDGSRDLTEDFNKAVDDLCQELIDTIGSIFMYREENTYTITKRIYEVNALTRRLIRLRRELDRADDRGCVCEDGQCKPGFKDVNCW